MADLFTPLEVRALHETPDNDPGRWFGCEHPERPADSGTQWDLRCRACALHSWATIKAGLADDPMPVARGVSSDLELADLGHREATIRALIDIHDVDPALLQ